jgi:hypothetical protein
MPPDAELDAHPRFTDETPDAAADAAEVSLPLKTFGVDRPARVQELMDAGLSEVAAREAAAVESGDLTPG